MASLIIEIIDYKNFNNKYDGKTQYGEKKCIMNLRNRAMLKYSNLLNTVRIVYLNGCIRFFGILRVSQNSSRIKN